MCLYMGETYMIIHVQHIRHVMLCYVGMCLCICTWICICVCIYNRKTRLCACIHACVSLRTCTHTQTHTHTSIYLSTYLSIYLYICTHMCMHMGVHICIHMHVKTHTCVQTYSMHVRMNYRRQYVLVSACTCARIPSSRSPYKAPHIKQVCGMVTQKGTKLNVRRIMNTKKLLYVHIYI